MKNNNVSVEVISIADLSSDELKNSVFDVSKELSYYSHQVDKLDYFIAISSGLLCGALDVLWVKEFNLVEGKEAATKNVNDFVRTMANKTGCKSNDITKCVKHLENTFPFASDGNINDFGGGYGHHLRDFSHHPTLLGLAFSLLTQFTGYSFGTDPSGLFLMVPVSKSYEYLIGKDIPSKIFNGTINWFFHLVSDVAGSSSSVGTTGGTGLPGPLLSTAKMFSSLPIFQGKDGKNNVSVFLSKVFNGTFLAEHKDGKIVRGTEFRFDLRAELGLAYEIGKMSIPVIANECIVRALYFVKQLAFELKIKEINSISDINKISWDNVIPFNNPTLSRMLTVSTGVFTTVDLTAAIITKDALAVNYIGVGRFIVSIGFEMRNFLKVRDLKKLEHMYDEIDNYIYRNNPDTNLIKDFSLTHTQLEILYNLEYLKTRNDILISSENKTIINRDVELKRKWLFEWKQIISDNFSEFLNDESAEMHWYSQEQLCELISREHPMDLWFKIVELESMLFMPYFPLHVTIENNEKCFEKTYDSIYVANNNTAVHEGNKYLDNLFTTSSDFSFAYYQAGEIFKHQVYFNRLISSMNSANEKFFVNGAIAVVSAIGIAVVSYLSAGTIAVALVGSSFAGLHGAALTSASLAYLGGGAIAAGGYGMAGGSMVIAGGGAFLGAGVGSGAGYIGNLIGNSEVNKRDYKYKASKLVLQYQMLKSNSEWKEILDKIQHDCESKSREEAVCINRLEHLLLNDDNKKLVKEKLADSKERQKILMKTIAEIKKQ